MPGLNGELEQPKRELIILKKWFDLIMANQEDLAILMTAEQGKPIAEAEVRLDTEHHLLNGLLKKEREPMEMSSQLLQMIEEF